jgi:hypothetical protein
MKKGLFKFTVSTLGIAALGLTANAQKVTELQEVSILAPHAVKIDGKNFEWNNADFSVNKRTSISYIMSNDDKNLYLVIKSTDVPNNSKIMAGGITLSVNPDGKKKEKESITLTYPVIHRTGRGPGGGGMRRIGGFGGGGAQPSAKERDSMMAAMQKTQLAQAKEIKINGFKNTTDTLISIYNEYSIKAFANIEKDNSFFYELQIPLAALGISTDVPKEFAYNIKLNGLQLPGLDGPGGGGGFGGGGGGGGGRGPGGGGGGGRGPGGGGGGRGPGGGNFDFQAMISPTDFWGKYTIRK